MKEKKISFNIPYQGSTLTLFREKEGVFSDVPMWVIFHGPYMYYHENLNELITQFKTEYQSDRHLIG